MPKFICKICGEVLSHSLQELENISLTRNEAEQDFISKGFYLPIDASIFYNVEHWPGNPKQYAVNLADILNSTPHPIKEKNDGCCNPDGTTGVNTVCLNGHEIGTRRFDCYQSKVMLLDPTKVSMILE